MIPRLVCRHRERSGDARGRGWSDRRGRFLRPENTRRMDQNRHGWFTRSFWPVWRLCDNVFPDHIPFLHRHFDPVHLEERWAKIPYIPLIQCPITRSWAKAKWIVSAAHSVLLRPRSYHRKPVAVGIDRERLGAMFLRCDRPAWSRFSRTTLSICSVPYWLPLVVGFSTIPAVYSRTRSPGVKTTGGAVVAVTSAITLSGSELGANSSAWPSASSRYP